MEFLLLGLVCLFFFYLFKSFVTTLDLMKVKEINDLPNYLNIIIIWTIPIYGAFRISKDIINSKKLKGQYEADFPPIMNFIPEDTDLDIFD